MISRRSALLGLAATTAGCTTGPARQTAYQMPVAPPPPPVARPAPPTPAAQPDDVAARLEAALRKPITPGAPPAAVRPGEPRPPVAPPPAQPRGPAAAPAAPAKTLSADEKSVFDSLEEEMAALLGRGPTPPKG